MNGKRRAADREEILRLFDLPGYEIVEVETEDGWCTLFLKQKAVGFRCPGCRRKGVEHRSTRWRGVRDLDLMARHVVLQVPVYRILCRECGMREGSVKIARRFARCTKRLERDLFALTKYMTVKAVADRTKLDWRAVKDAEVRHIRALLRKRKVTGVRRIGIDEVSYQKRHRYLTLVTDLDGHRVIYATFRNDGGSVRRFLRWFGPERSARLTVVVTDMHQPFIKVIRKQLPNAALVFDHFHVSKLIHDAIDAIRRRLQRDLSKEDREVIKGKRWVLLIAKENLSEKQQVSLAELMEMNAELAAAYILKEDFRWAFKAKARKAGEKRLGRWEGRARESGIPEFQKILQTIKRRREGIMNFFEYQVANGMAEGFNNVVGTIRKQAYGFHDRDYLRLKVLRVCGKLDESH